MRPLVAAAIFVASLMPTSVWAAPPEASASAMSRHAGTRGAAISNPFPGPWESGVKAPAGMMTVLYRGQVFTVPAPTTRGRVAPQLEPIVSSPNLILGIPKAEDKGNELLINKGTYVTSYNPTEKIPNWVSWKVDESNIANGVMPRQNDFRSDKKLPKDFERVTPSDYLHSGYDMGHIIPSGDRSRHANDNTSTFLMTNMTPQRPDLNRGPWFYLEDYTRMLATEKGKDVYVVAGGILPDRARTIGDGVTVPKSFFKVAVVVDKGKGPESITKDSQVIAVIMPNKQGIRTELWSSYIVSPKEIEKQTGYQLFTNLPPKVRAALESKKAEIHLDAPGAHPE